MENSVEATIRSLIEEYPDLTREAARWAVLTRYPAWDYFMGGAFRFARDAKHMTERDFRRFMTDQFIGILNEPDPIACSKKLPNAETVVRTTRTMGIGERCLSDAMFGIRAGAANRI